jgi:hypothetical protein
MIIVGSLPRSAVAQVPAVLPAQETQAWAGCRRGGGATITLTTGASL